MENYFTVSEQRPSAVELVVDKIKALLVEEKLKPGDMLPSENVLAESLQVSRGSIREAVKILCAYGVLEIKRGTGTFISTASNKKLFNPHLFQILLQERDYDSLTQVREILEEGIIKLVIQYASEEELEVLDDAMQRFLNELSGENPSLELASSYDIQYHRLLGKFSHNAILDNIYSFIVELFTPTINPVHSGVYNAHKNLHESILNRDSERIVELVHEHTITWITSHKDV